MQVEGWLDNSSTVSHGQAEYVRAGAGRWIGLVVRVCGSSFLIIS